MPAKWFRPGMVGQAGLEEGDAPWQRQARQHCIVGADTPGNNGQARWRPLRRPERKTIAAPHRSAKSDQRIPGKTTL
jgi:hypothetical protein